MPALEAFDRLRAVFDAVADRPPEERRRVLDELCRGEPALQKEVEDLLAAEAGASTFLAGLSLAAGAAVPMPSLLGRQLGAYRIEEKLDDGGMSTVYLAVRTDLTYQQRVAVKVFGFSPDRADLLSRFQAERQILASLSHPAIARLLDGGATAEGLPYLVMELVDGLPVDRYCDRHGLSIAERIDLFLKVCAAVAYAHRHLVVHRDLKPPNILVDVEGNPKLLDFGIAKLLAGAPLPLPDQATRTGLRLMTPQYASPEQVTGGAITTATDVYALGVLLYVLLTGRLPYRFDAERSGALERAITEQAPEPPSQAAPQARRALAGDLDNIVLTALRKEASQRYPAVDLLAEDLRRHRQGLPVAARPATLGYRLRKLVGRNRLAVAAGSATFLLLLSLAVTMTLQSVRLRRERDRAVEVTRFLEETFRSADPEEGQGKELTARQLLDRGGERIEKELRGQPELQASLALTIGRAYASLGLYEPAARFLELSLALRRKRLGERSPEVADCLDNLALLHEQRGDLERAEAAARRALAIREALRGRDDPDLAETVNALGLVRLDKGDLAGAEPLFRRALALGRKRSGAADPGTVEILGNLAVIRRVRGDLASAAALYQEAVGLERRRPGRPRPARSVLLGNLGVVLTHQGDRAGAEAAFRESLTVARQIYGAEHPSIALQLNNLATALIDRGDLATAESLYRQALAMQRKLLGGEHEHVAATLNNLADLLAERGDPRGARQLYEESLRIVRRLFGDDDPRTADRLANLSRLFADQGDLAAAEPPAREALAIRRKRLGEAHPAYGNSLVALGGIRQGCGKLSEAEPLLRQGLAVLRRALPADHPDVATAESRLGDCLAARGRPAEAEPLLFAGYQSLNRKLGPNHPRTAAALKRLSAFHAAGGDARAAAEGRARLPR